jgi:RNA polymerase sigma-70 factor (ECF subfamily)
MTKAALALGITQTLNRVLAKDRGRLLSALTVRLRDFQLAEDMLQEAAVSALTHWGRSGIPTSPEGWLLKVAFRKAIDRLRASARTARNAADLAFLAEEEAAETEPDMIPDERLRLIFTCCHPALEPKTRIALTLRTVCGLTTAQVAAVFLDPEPTMGQRLTRAKGKIIAAGIPFRLPDPADFAERLNSVLTVVYLVFTAGYTKSPQLGRDLCEEALFLARLIAHLSPDQPEVEGCFALLMLTHARVAARIDAMGCTVPPGQQDQSLWNHAALHEGRALLDRAMARGRPGPFQIKAAIAACHAMESGPDWPQIAALYEALLRWEPSPTVALSLTVAQMEAGAVNEAAAALAALAPALEEFQPFHAARAEVLRRQDRQTEARQAYDRALALTTAPEDAAFLTKARAGLTL